MSHISLYLYSLFLYMIWVVIVTTSILIKGMVILILYFWVHMHVRKFILELCKTLGDATIRSAKFYT